MRSSNLVTVDRTSTEAREIKGWLITPSPSSERVEPRARESFRIFVSSSARAPHPRSRGAAGRRQAGAGAEEEEAEAEEEAGGEGRGGRLLLVFPGRTTSSPY